MVDEEILFPSEDVFEAAPAGPTDELEQRHVQVDTLRGAYHRIFTGEGSAADARVVMKDLYREGCGATPTFRPDPREHAYYEGRRSMLLRILRFGALDTAALFKNNQS